MTEQEETENLDAFHKTFERKEDEKSISPLLKGLGVVVLFWGSFIAIWVSMPLITSKDTKINLPKAPKVAFNFNDEINRLGTVLGLQSKWNTENSIAYLKSNRSQIIDRLETGSLIGTYTITPSGKTEGETYTLSTEFNKAQNISYSSLTALSGNSIQVITHEDEVLTRNNSQDKWGRNEEVENLGFSTEEALGLRIINLILKDEVIQEKMTYKGSVKDEEKEVLEFSINFNAEELNSYLETSSEDQLFFSSMYIEINLDPTKNTLNKVDIQTKQVFIGENQFDTKKVIEYVSTGGKDLKNILPKESEISTEEIEFKERDIFVRFLDII